MAIDRPDDNSPADDGRDRQPDRADRGRSGRDGADDRRVPEEQRGRAELYADLRAAERDGQPPDRDDPRTTHDGGWEWKGLKLSPEANRLADQEISDRRSAEGRSADGTYGDNGITPAMRRVEARLDHGSLVPDTEKFALKSPDRFKEKLAKMVERRPDTSPSELAREIHDGIRYTFFFNVRHYTDGTQDACAKLSEERYELTRLANRWDGEEYKGINSRWHDPRSGQFFEVQFHTPESWDAKQKTHDSYEKLDNPSTPVREVEELRAYQREITSGIALPDRWREITDYRKPES